MIFKQLHLFSYARRGFSLVRGTENDGENSPEWNKEVLYVMC